MNVELKSPRLWTPPRDGESPLPLPVGRPLYVRTHLDLPFEDPSVAKNYNEHPQAMLLTATIEPHLRQRHPDGQFSIGQDSYIYFDDTDPPVAGARAPDWFYVPGVPPMPEGEIRRSYVLWRERVPPVILIEFVSGDGSEEHDARPGVGKFWVYEQRIQAEYYAIFDPFRATLEVFRLIGGSYELVPANAHGHFPIVPMDVELGLWSGRFLNMDMTWLRWWGADGRLLATPEEQVEQERQRAAQEHQRAEQEQRRAEAERQRAEQFAAKLRELGVDPNSL
jgi:Uma2 family endonuclease